jgi:DNA-binding beta-propeller fold protein YncE
VFDTVPPAGSIVVEGGRFASNSTRTLHLTACDSASGVAMMRFMNRPRVDMVENGGFDPAGGVWSFTGSGSGYDTSLQLGRFSVGPSQESRATQYVPAESISAYSGDSCVLEAGILAHMHDGDATGDVSFWFYHIRVDSLNLHDSLWALVDSACYSGDLLSLTGRYNLSTRFLLSAPTPESGWVWRGGMVRVRAQGVDGGTGTVWCDNVLMNAYEPQASGYAWWANYDSLLADWDIGSGAGMKVVRALFRDSAGTENAVPYADTVILDPTPPVVDISMPMPGLLVNGLVDVTGWAYDPVESSGDTWFSEYRLRYRHWDSTNWRPVSPDSISHIPAYPDSMSSQGPAVHLGYWNTLALEDGSYYLLLTASDSAGNTSSCTTWVMVDQGFGGGGMRSGPEGGGSGMGEGSVFVGSTTGTVLHLGDDLDSLDAFSVNDSGSQVNITAILEVGEDSILVLDAHNKRVHKLHRSGQHRRRLVSGLSQPADLKQDTNGNFWLVDKGWNRIGKFRSNGTLVFVRGGLGADSLHFHSPEGIAVKGGLVYVADGGNNRIAVWDTSGHFKTTITGDFENPTAVYVSDAGAIYLTDGTDGKLKGITPLGGNIVTIGTADSSKLKGLVPSQNRHSLFSLASEPNKVYKLRIQSDESRPGGAQSGGRVNLPKTLALNQPFPNPARTKLNIAYALPRQTRVELKLYDVAGKLVTTLANGQQKPGYYSMTWNRKDSKGRSCACGVYFCTMAAENQRFSRKVILTE